MLGRIDQCASGKQFLVIDEKRAQVSVPAVIRSESFRAIDHKGRRPAFAAQKDAVGRLSVSTRSPGQWAPALRHGRPSYNPNLHFSSVELSRCSRNCARYAFHPGHMS